MTIVFYTHKASMIRNWVIPLSDFFGAKIYVFHINSLDKEMLVEPEDIEFIDISRASATRIIKHLKDISPNAYISLGFRSLIELLLLRICKHLSIKTIYLEHGLYTIDTTRLNAGNIKGNPAYVLRKYVNFILKYVKFLFICRKPVREVCCFFQGFIRKQYQESRYDKALFFSRYGFLKLNEFFEYNENDIVFCGYPLFLSNNERDQVTQFVSRGPEAKKIAVYVHQPFILNNQTEISYEEEVLFVKEIIKSLGDRYILQLLLHPRESLDRYRALYIDSGIEVVQRPNDYNVFFDKSLVVGHYSTALLYPIYFGTKTVIVDYPGVEIDKLYVAYCPYVHTPSELPDCLFNEGYSGVCSADIEFLLGHGNSYEYIADKLRGLLC